MCLLADPPLPLLHGEGGGGVEGEVLLQGVEAGGAGGGAGGPGGGGGDGSGAGKGGVASGAGKQ